MFAEVLSQVAASQNLGSSPPQGGGEVARAKPETERGAADLPSRRSPAKIARARELRHGDNLAEATLWNERTEGQETRRVQVRSSDADRAVFCRLCLSRTGKLVVELDGSQHADDSYDRRRDEFMRGEGFSVMRFWSADMLRSPASVCETILAALDGRLSEDTIASDLRFVFAVSKPPKATDR